MADKKFDQFTDGGEMKVGDIPVGLRTSNLATNFKFDFPGTGIKDSNGNYLLQYSTAGASAVNYPKFTNSITGQPVIYTAGGTDANVDISIQPKGSGQLILDELNWPTADGAANTFLYTDGAGNLAFTGASVATAIIGTANQVLANGTSGSMEVGNVTLTTPQNIAPTSSPTFANLTLTNPLPVASGGTGLATYTTNGILFASAPTTIGQVTGVNRASLSTNATGVPTLLALTDGQIVIGSTAGAPAAASLTAGSGITITPGSNSISIAASSGAGSPLTTKGDIYTFTTVNARLPVGTVDGQILQVNAAAATGLAYSTATYPATTTISQLLYSSAANTVSGLATANSAILYTNSTGVPALSASLTDGQVMIGSTGASPTPATITPGTGISVANTAGAITISATGGGFGVATIAGTTQAASVNTMYIALNAGQTNVTLPAVFSVGDSVIVVGATANVGGVLFTAAGGDTIMYNGTATSAGGTITSSALAGQSIEVVADIANTSWVVRSTVNTTLTTA